MKKYFDIFIEFDRYKVNDLIENAILNSKKGYICVIDGNVLANANRNKEYRKVINGGLVNLCDGSSIALLAGIIHEQHFSTYTGPDIFTKYVKENCKQYFLGNTEDNLQRLKARFIELGYNVKQFKFNSLPFKEVDDFDYATIAKDINDFSPDIIWVSLGAPKQEIFISKIIPFLEKGILFGIGAAFNFYLGDKKNKRAPTIMRYMNMEWLFRFSQEPKKQFNRIIFYLSILPKLIINELKNTKINNH